MSMLVRHTIKGENAFRAVDKARTSPAQIVAETPQRSGSMAEWL